MTAIITADQESSPSSSPSSLSLPPPPERPDASSVQVAVRVRPMIPHEAGNPQCIDVLSTTNSNSKTNNSKQYTVVRLGGDAGPKFTFDQVFPLTTSQVHVFQNCVAPLVTSCLEGYNATILAYGQTGSGKTHTIMGPSSSMTSSLQNERQAGVIPRAIRSIFDQLERLQNNNGGPEEEEEKKEQPRQSYEYDVRVQFLEVYGEEIRDLLSTQQPSPKLSIRDVGMDEPEVVGATEQKVESPEEALLCLTRGMYRRVTGATAMNEESSRSHAFLSLIVEQSTEVSDIDAHCSSTSDNKTMKHVQAKRSKFNFVDLAGSERLKRTQATGRRLKEGIDINKGLLVLGNVISALGDLKKQGKTFVPYRDSKLTRLLKGSLGGNHKTLMMACVSPAANNMEETLNCLRYANRAKNIQNHAVVNLDNTSRLVADLRGKMRMLATDLLKSRSGNFDECTIPMEVVESLANGGDGEDIPRTEHRGDGNHGTPSPLRIRPRQRQEEDAPQSTGNSFIEQELQRVKAENEVFCLRIESLSKGDDPSQALQQAFIARAAEYEREIAMLRGHGGPPVGSSVYQSDFDNTIAHQNQPYLPNLPPRTPISSQSKGDPTRGLQRSDSPELNRLRAQMFGSMAQSNNLDQEVEAEEKAVAALTSKYLGKNADDGDEDDNNHENDDSHHQMAEETCTEDENLSLRFQADLYELENSIGAKEDLIQKLLVSQEKYEAMREFYEEKLNEMSTLLAEKELESEKLGEELQKLDNGHGDSKAMAEKLRQKKEQVAGLKKKQAELTRLTAVASRNESQISRLRNEVVDMKQKKVDLQKQMTNERKSHLKEVQKLKKESMQKDRELNKVKKISDVKATEAKKAQQIAKYRLEQMNQLKSRYKETEKRLRIKTVKRGVMTKAGLDPVMVGRRQSKPDAGAKNSGPSKGVKDEGINFDSLRDFFDQKVAEVGRREALAEKLAQEWEDHLDLSMQKDEFLTKGSQGNALEHVETQIKYKEDRIRQLAARLGKRQKESAENSPGEDPFLFDQGFQKIVGKISPMMSTQTAAKVLFGMVVRERRRIASLARTASSLDEKVQEAEATASAKDAAFRAHVDEQRHEAAALAQNQQEHILSLMEMVREEPIQDSDDVDDATKSRIGENGKRAFLSEGKGNSKLLVLANERIAVLERQLHELQLGREAIVKHREREDEAKALLDEKTKECEELEEELLDLRSALRHIREEVSCPKDKSESVSPTNEDGVHFSTLQSVFDIVVKSLHPTSGWSGTKSKRQKSSASSRNIAMSPGLSIERDTQFVHTSDSDEMPDWAEDIMQDLAIIAEGKMPSSLLESPGVLDAEAQLEKTNVFERLTNPESFTGIQKQKNSRNTRTKKVRHPAEPSSDGHKQRKMISKHVADSLSKVVVPGENSKPTDTGGKLSEEKVSSVKSDSTKRSVFDRLLSPSNMTGTQRHKNQGKNGKPTRSGSLNLEKTFDSEATCSKHFQFEDEAPDEKNAEEMLDDILLRDDKDNLGVTNQSNTSKNQSASLNSTKREESDVFERLNKTTTQAYAVKQHVNIAEKMLEDILDDTEGSEVTTEGERSKSEPHFERVDEYVQQNVFERLQKTTTLAYAGKQNSNIVEKKPEKLPQSEHSSPVGKGKQDILLSPSSSRTIATPGKKKASVLSGDERNPRSTAIETGLISNSADRLLDDILDN